MSRSATDAARTALQGLAPVLLSGSGVLMIMASRERWWPACRLGDFDAPDCLTLQDHRFDFLPPTEPWVPVGAAAQVGAGSMVLLSLALLFLPWLLGGAQRPVVTLLVGAVLVAPLLTLAVMTGRSGLSGRVVAGPGLEWVYWLWILTPIALLLMVFAFQIADPRPGIEWRLLVVGLVSVSTPLGEFFIAGALLGLSYDTTPWSEAVSGVFLVAAGLALWPAIRSRSAAQIAVPSPV
ncbi:hypothetical protein BA895_19270 [Humibacillus sp. DSM 29435]|uniref:hypothetical protein n=1 Tax=Humibacillus sp. DSM 29435 TaxID=1869167 RepID=UPI0008725286|nr:hypothetical protein [Humibacillus sp. DSM 29435]OFE16319.1 hypothetical protein BA895_19270 [Humibacillus sp. DSM 29435]